MFRRTRPLLDPVTLYLDGSPIPAERGEPIAVSLLASDMLTLARSPKLHRPRGPSCLRGACDGCLARVDGEPNVMTCLRPARGGEQIETQNVVGSRKADLLRVTDWFFPKGFDHHHFMAGVPGLSDVMQSFARKVAGLGKLPAEPLDVQSARRLDVDVAVIGGGPAGIAVASKLASAGRRVCLVDDGLTLGGSLVAAPDRLARLLDSSPLTGVVVHHQSVAAGVYLGEILVIREPDERDVEAGVFTGASVVRARAKVFATGAQDGVLGVPNNDLPGVFSARALCRLLAYGVDLDGAIVIVGEGAWADELSARLGDRVKARVAPGDLAAIEGSSSARAVVVKSGSKERTIKVSAVAIAARGAPSFEVAAQAGAVARYVPGAGYAVICDERGRSAEGVWAVGECTGAALDDSNFEDAARIVAADVEETLRRPEQADGAAFAL